MTRGIARAVRTLGFGAASPRTFTANGALTSEALPNQPGGTGTATVGTLRYDAASRLTGLSVRASATANYLTSVAFSLRGQPFTTVYGNGATD